MDFTQEQITKAKRAKSAEELLALAKENGMELTEEEAKKYFEQWHKECELADEELGNVVGGCGGDPHAEHLAFSPKNKTSASDCPVCGGELDFVKDVRHKSGHMLYSVYYCPKGGVYFDREVLNNGYYSWGLDKFLND